VNFGRNWLCNICKRAYAHKHGLMKHLARAHADALTDENLEGGRPQEEGNDNGDDDDEVDVVVEVKNEVIYMVEDGDGCSMRNGESQENEIEELGM